MTLPTRKLPASADPFRYGWRPKYVHLPGGEVVEEQIPLTPEDLLDPQLGDVVPQSGEHFDYAHSTVHLLRDRYSSRQEAAEAENARLRAELDRLRKSG